MFDFDATAVALEVKFASGAGAGEFDGYGAIFGTEDTHGDVILPGAFTASLNKTAAEGRKLPMYAEHGPYVGGDHLPVGVWNSVQEDNKGLKMSGQIASMDTDYGKRIHSLVKTGALGGLSIEYRVPPGGAIYGKAAGQPKRTLKTLDLKGVSLVADPSHAKARVADIKSAAMQAGDKAKATAAVAAAMLMHDKTMGSNYSEATPKDKALLMEHLRDAHEALTGSRAPDGMDGWTKSAPTIREFEEFLREKGFSNSEATHIAERGFKSLPRDGVVERAITPNVKSALDAFRAAAEGF